MNAKQRFLAAIGIPVKNIVRMFEVARKYTLKSGEQK